MVVRLLVKTLSVAYMHQKKIAKNGGRLVSGLRGKLKLGWWWVGYLLKTKCLFARILPATIPPPMCTPAPVGSPAPVSASGRKASQGEDCDYDMDHESSCPPFIPPAISRALVGLVDGCCGPSFRNARRVDPSAILVNPCRGLLRVRRASDLALTALFGLALDLDLVGGDHAAAAQILKAIASRYCQAEGGDRPGVFRGEDYGSLLRRQVNLQYFLDCIRIRLDGSVPPPLCSGVVVVDGPRPTGGEGGDRVRGVLPLRCPLLHAPLHAHLVRGGRCDAR